jgi:mRNA interferase MazF
VAERGDVYRVDFNPTKGREQKGVRPAIVLSINPVNRRGWTVVVVPLTGTRTGLTIHPEIQPTKANGLGTPSYVLADQLRAVTNERLLDRLGAMSPAELEKVELAVLVTLGLQGRR